MQYGLLYLPISTHGFSLLAILYTGAAWSLVSYKLAKKLPVTVQDMIYLTIKLPMGKTMVTA